MSRLFYSRAGRSVYILAAAGVALAGAAAPVRSQTVIATVPVGLSPHSVAVDSTRNLVFIGQTDSFGQGIAEVAVIDGASNTVLTTIPVSGPVGQTGLAVNESTGLVYAAVRLGLEVIDANTLALVSFISLSPGVGVVGVDPVTNRVYATGPSTTLQVIDGASETVVASIALPQIPSDLEVDPLRNEVYVATSPFGFAVIDGASNTLVTTVPVNNLTLDVGVDPQLGQAYFTQRGTTSPASLFAVDTPTLSTLATLSVGPRTEGVGVDTSTHRVYTGSGSIFPNRGVTVVDGVTLAVVNFVPTSDPVGRPVGVNSTTHRIYIPNGMPEPNGRVVVLEDQPPVIEVLIDVKPGSDPNSINPRSRGVVPVAIVTTSTADGDAADFDATQVDPISVELGPGGASEAHGTGHFEDVDGDGDLDLVLHFSVGEVGIACGETKVSLTGETFTGDSISGDDAIQTVGC